MANKHNENKIVRLDQRLPTDSFAKRQLYSEFITKRRTGIGWTVASYLSIYYEAEKQAAQNYLKLSMYQSKK